MASTYILDVSFDEEGRGVVDDVMTNVWVGDIVAWCSARDEPFLVDVWRKNDSDDLNVAAGGHPSAARNKLLATIEKDRMNTESALLTLHVAGWRSQDVRGDYAFRVRRIGSVADGFVTGMIVVHEPASSAGTGVVTPPPGRGTPPTPQN